MTWLTYLGQWSSKNKTQQGLSKCINMSASAVCGQIFCWSQDAKPWFTPFVLVQARWCRWRRWGFCSSCKKLSSIFFLQLQRDFCGKNRIENLGSWFGYSLLAKNKKQTNLNRQIINISHLALILLQNTWYQDDVARYRMCKCRGFVWFRMMSSTSYRSLGKLGQSRWWVNYRPFLLGPFASHCLEHLWRICETRHLPRYHVPQRRRYDDVWVKSHFRSWDQSLFFFWMTPCQTCLKKETTEKNHMTCSCFHEGFFFRLNPFEAQNIRRGSAIFLLIFAELLCQRWTRQRWISSIPSPCFGVALYFCKAASF